MRKDALQLPRKVQSSDGAEEEDGTDVAFHGIVMLALKKMLRYHGRYTQAVSAKCTYSAS